MRNLNLMIYLSSFNSIILAKTALIFGITGQDGYYLSNFLLKKNYNVHGVVRRVSTDNNTKRLSHLLNDKKIHLHYGDLSDQCNILSIIQKVDPDEIYNLAAQSHVGVSFESAEYTANIDALGTLRILEAILKSGKSKSTKFYQASSSEMFGKVKELHQNENTPFYPRSPYGVSKLFSYWITINYRESYNLFACNGILFNHESPKRGDQFVTRKITKFVAQFKKGLANTLYLGNLDSKRDWGFAGDYVEAMWLMLQQPSASDYVIATEETHSVREFVVYSFKEIGIDIEWRGTGVEEVGVDKKTKQVLVKVDPQYFRPAEVEFLLGNASKAKKELGWVPKTNFEDLVKMMIESDINELN